MQNKHLLLIGWSTLVAIHLTYSGQRLILFTGIFLLLLFFFVSKKNRAIILLCMGSFIIFSLRAMYEENSISNWNKMEDLELTVYFTHPIDYEGNKIRSIVETAEGTKLLFETTVENPSRAVELQKKITPGIQCKINGVITPPPKASNFHAFDYKNYLHSKGVSSIIRSDSLHLKNCSVDSSLFSFTFLQYVQRFMTDKIQTNLPSPTKELTLALILGDRKGLDPDVLEAYERLGIVHLLAISGLHVGLLFTVLFGCFIRFGLTRESSMVLLLVVLPIYSVISGGAPSVVRSVFMATILLIVALCKIRVTLLHIFYLTFFIVLLLEPLSIYAVGFQLSYGVTFSLILSIQIFSRQTGKFISLWMVSLVATISSLPFLLFHFYSFSPYSILINLLFVPFYSLIILPLCWVLALFVILLGQAPFPLVEFSNRFIMALHLIAVEINKWPISSLILGRPQLFQLLTLIKGSLLLFIRLEIKKAPILLVLFILSVISCSFFIPKLHAEVTVINVGQGDAILIDLPLHSGTYLIDTGGVTRNRDGELSYVAAESVIIPYLKSLGITKIDKLILSHGDLDHAGGASLLLRNLVIKELVLGRKFIFSDLEKEIMGIAKAEGIPIRFAQAQDSWRSAKTSFEILSPRGDERNENDRSIVIQMTMGEAVFLFTGDISSNKEQQLIQSTESLREVDFLKLAHHGSNTSTSMEFLKELKPSFAIISAGKNNMYGHPHEEVLKRIEDQGISVLRTDEDGAILFKINPFSFVTIETKLP